MLNAKSQRLKDAKANFDPILCVLRIFVVQAYFIFLSILYKAKRVLKKRTNCNKVECDESEASWILQSVRHLKNEAIFSTGWFNFGHKWLKLLPEIIDTAELFD